MEERGYTVIRCLGQGGQGRVYEVHDRNGKLRVVKQLPWMDKQDKEHALQEVRLLSSLRHPCIVPYLESFLARSSPSVPSEDLLCLVMSRCERDLHAECLQRREHNQHFDEPRIIAWLAQLCWGLQHLHARKVLHRDLKTHNVLLTQSGRVLLADFGVAGHLEHTEDFKRSIVGTPSFMSPEMLEGRPYGCETDQWALGCVLFEIMALEPPFAACDSYASVITAVLHSPVHIQAPPGYSLELNSVVEALLARKPHERPSNNDLLRTPLLRGPFNSFLQSVEARASESLSPSRRLSDPSGRHDNSPRASISTPSETGQGSSSLRSTMRHMTGQSCNDLSATHVTRAAASSEVNCTVAADDTPRTKLMREAEAASHLHMDMIENVLRTPSPGFNMDTPVLATGNASPEQSRFASHLTHLGSHDMRGPPTCRSTASSEDIHECSTNVLGNAGVGAGEWRQLLAEAESLLVPIAPEQAAREEAIHQLHSHSALRDLLGSEEQVNRALGFLRERRPLGLGEVVEAETDELLLQVEVVDFLGDEGLALRALPLLERLLAYEAARSPDLPR